MIEKEFIGIFVNYFYLFSNTHGGLETDMFYIKTWNGIKYIAPSSKYTYLPNITNLKKALEKITPDIHYSYWLRSSFENPVNSNYQNFTLTLEVNYSPNYNSITELVGFHELNIRELLGKSLKTT